MKKFFLIIALIATSTLFSMENEVKANELEWPITPAIVDVFNHIAAIIKPQNNNAIYPCIEKVSFNESYTKGYCNINFFKKNEQIAHLSFTIDALKKPFYVVFLDIIFIKKTYQGKGFGKIVLQDLLNLFSFFAKKYKVSLLFHLKSDHIVKAPDWAESQPNDVLLSSQSTENRINFYRKRGLSPCCLEALSQDEKNLHKLHGEPLYFGIIFEGNTLEKITIPDTYQPYQFKSCKAVISAKELTPFYKQFAQILKPLFLDKKLNNYDPVSLSITHYYLEKSTSTLREIFCYLPKSNNPKTNKILHLLNASCQILKNTWEIETRPSDNSREEIIQKKFASLVADKDTIEKHFNHQKLTPKKFFEI